MKRYAGALLGLAVMAAGVMAEGSTGPARAQEANFPSRPVTIILPASAGGGSDTITRAFANKLSQIWGQPVVVENRPGAGGAIGTDLVAKAKPDGYTLLSAFSEHSWMKYFATKVPYDMNKDFVPIGMMGSIPNVVALSGSIKANTIQELVAFLKANPGKLNFGSGGVGSTLHLFGELFKKQNGVDIVHVPYKGANEANLGLISGQIEMVFPTALSIKPHAAAGKAKVLAASSPERLAVLPDVPTAAEAGIPDFKVSIWYCMFAPAGTPKEVVAKINADMVKAAQAPEVRERLGAIGVQLASMSPEQFDAFFRSEQKRWGEIIETAGIKLN